MNRSWHCEVGVWGRLEVWDSELQLLLSPVRGGGAGWGVGVGPSCFLWAVMFELGSSL